MATSLLLLSLGRGVAIVPRPPLLLSQVLFATNNFANMAGSLESCSILRKTGLDVYQIASVGVPYTWSASASSQQLLLAAAEQFMLILAAIALPILIL